MNGKDSIFLATSDEEATFDAAMVSGVNFSRLLIPSFDTTTAHPNFSSSSFPTTEPVALFSYPDLLPSLAYPPTPPPPQLLTFSTPPPPPSFSSSLFEPHLKLPKPEPGYDHRFLFHPTFHHLPELHNLDPTHPQTPTRTSPDLSSPSPSHKRPRDLDLNPQLRQIPAMPPVMVPTSALARQRRTRMSDKTRCLQRLIPKDRQMDTATLYEEAYKYIKFLEAQISVLQAMPVETPAPVTEDDMASGGVVGGGGGEYGELERLNRQQLLQVMVNSQPAQTLMYTNGWCVFTVEQLAELREKERQKIVEQKFL